MTIALKTIKILWANAAGRCSFPDCNERLCIREAASLSRYTIGEMAHICGERLGANRHDPVQTQAQRDAYDNLILLCPTHHTLIDKPENEGLFSSTDLLEMKAKHEEFVIGRLEATHFADKKAVARYFYSLMQENHEVFCSFGPHSEIARRNPESDAHSVWLSERLTTIIPNNRKMVAVAETYLDLFAPSEQAIIGKFRLHVRTYDRWVRDETSYEGVVRFPTEFESLVTELANA